MAEYVLRIVVEGRDKSGVKTVNNLRKSLQNLSKVALTGLAVGLGLVAAGIGKLVFESVDAASQLQELGIALETLVAKELARGDEATVTTKTIIHLSEKERKELQKKMLDYDKLAARLQELRQKAIAASQMEGGTERLDYKRYIADIAEAEYRLGELGNRIDELKKKEGSLGTTTETIRINQMDLNKALSMAKGPAKDLIVQLREMSLLSPYQFNQVADTFRFAMALGASSTEATGLTESVLDMGAALGLNNEQLDRMQYNLAQAVIAGDLTNINLRQLKLVGVDLAEVFEDQLGMSIEEVRNQMKLGKMDYHDLAKAFQDYTQKYFGGAAERMTRTFTGLRNNLKDLFFFVGADLFGPALDDFSAKLSEAFDKLHNALKEGKIAELGKSLGKILKPFSEALSKLLVLDMSGFFDDLATGFYALMKAMGFDWGDSAKFITELFEFIKNLFALGADTGGGLLQALRDLADDILPVLTSALEWANENWEIFRAALLGVAAVLAGGVIIGALGTLAGALASPITLLIGLSAAIGAISAIWGDDIKEAFGKISGFFKDIAREFEESGVAGVLNTLAGFFGDIVTAFQDEGVAGAIEEFKNLWPDIKTKIGEGLTGIWEVIEPYLTPVAENLISWGETTLSNMFGKDVDFSEILTNIQGTFGEVTGIFDSIITALGPTIDKLEGFAKGLSEAFEKGGLVGALEELRDLMPGIIDAISEGFGEVAKILEPIAEEVGKQAESVGSKFVASLSKFLGVDLVAMWEGVQTWFATTVNDISTTLTGWVDSVISAITEPIEKAKEAIQPFIDAFMSVVGPAIEEFKGTLEDLQPVFDEAKERFQPLVDAFNTLAEAAAGLWEDIMVPFLEFMVTRFGQFLGVVFVGLLGAVAGAIKGILGAVGGMLEGIIRLGGALASIFGGAIKIVIGVVQMFAGALTQNSEKIGEGWANIAEGFNAVIDGILGAIGGLYQTAIVPVREFFTGLFSGLLQYFNELPFELEEVLQSIGDTVSGWAAAVQEFFDGIQEGAYNFGSNLATAVEEGIQDFVDLVVGFFESLYDTLIGNSVIPDMIEDIIDAFAALPGDMIKEAAKSLGEFADLGEDMIKGIKQGIEDVWDGFLKWLLDQLLKIPGAIAQLFKSESPSKVMAAESQNWVEGLRLGWKRSFGSLLNDVNSSLGGILPGAQYPGGAMTPAGLPMGRGGITHTEHHNYYISNPAAAGLVMAVVEQQRQERLNVMAGG